MFDDAAHLKKVGSGLLDTEQYSLAIDFLTRSIELDKEDAETFRLRGVAFFRTLNIAAAVTDLEKAIVLDPEDHFAQADLGEIFLKKQDYVKAEACYENALRVNESCIEYLSWLALLKFKLKKHDEALVLCNSVVDLVADKSWILNLRGYVLIEFKRYAEALNDIVFLIKADPDNFGHYNDAGYVHSKMGQNDLAKKNLDIALALHPDNSNVHSNMGYVFLREQRFSEAMEWINHALELDPSNSYAYKNRALVWLAMEIKEEAIKDLQAARLLGFADLFDNEVDQLLQDITN